VRFSKANIVGQWQEKIDKIKKPADVNYIWEEIKRTKVKVLEH
jgi:hypothetical protein